MAYSQNINILNTTSFQRNSYVTLGIPFPIGELTTSDKLVVDGATSQRENVQWYPQGGLWTDGSVKFARATFPVSIGANSEMSATVRKSTNLGATSTFTSNITSDINNTRFRFKMDNWVRYYAPVGTDGPVKLASWEKVTVTYGGVTRDVTQVTFANYSMRARDDNSPVRESNLGYFRSTSNVTNLPPSGSNYVFVNVTLPPRYPTTGPYSGNLIARWINSSTLQIWAYDQSYFPGGVYGAPTFSSEDVFLTIGLWEPSNFASNGTIDLNLSEATLVEEVSGSSEPESHYKRYKVFKRGNNVTVPEAIWAELVFDKFKNSDTIRWWFSWGNSYCAVTTGSLTTHPSNSEQVPGPSANPAHTYYYQGQISLEIYSTGTTGYTPRVGFNDIQVQGVYPPTFNNGVTRLVMLDTEYQKYLTNTNGTLREKIFRNSLPFGFTLSYKGKIVYTNTLTPSNNADLTGRDVLAVANWQGMLPPYYSRLDLPPQFNGNTATAKADLRAFIDQTENSLILHQPVQAGSQTSFSEKSRPSESGSQGLLFNANTGYWFLTLQDPYPLRIIEVINRRGSVRPLWKREADGDMIRYLDYINPSGSPRCPFTVNGMLRTNSWGWFGIFADPTYSTPQAPMPVLMGGGPLGNRSLDNVYGVVKSSGINEGVIEITNEPLIGWSHSHFSPDYHFLAAFLTMDYGCLAYCRTIYVQFWTEGWSGSRGTSGGVDGGSARKHTREISRQYLSGAILLELFGDAEHLTEMKAKVSRIESGNVNGTTAPGHLGYLVDDMYGTHQYDTRIYPYELGNAPEAQLAQEWAFNPWMDFMGTVHFWGVQKVLARYSGTSTQVGILKKVAADLAATCFYNNLHHTDDYVTLQTNTVSALRSASTPEQVYPEPSDIAEYGDIIEDVNNPSNYATVLNVQVDDEKASNTYACKLQIQIKDRVGGPMNGAVLRNRTTGNLCRNSLGAQFTVTQDRDLYRLVYSHAVTPPPTLYSTSVYPGAPGFAPDYFKRIPLEDLYRLTGTYEYNTTLPPIKGVRGTAVPQYTKNILRYGYQDGSTFFWGLGSASIAAILAQEGYLPGIANAVIAKAQLVFNEFYNALASFPPVWEYNIGNNLFVEPINTTGNTHIYIITTPINLTIDILPETVTGGSVSISALHVVSAPLDIDIRAYTPAVNLGTAAIISARKQDLDVRTFPVGVFTAVENDVVVTPPTLVISLKAVPITAYGTAGVLADVTVELGLVEVDLQELWDSSYVTATQVFSVTHEVDAVLDIELQLTTPAVFGYERPETGRVWFSRRLTYILDTSYSDTFTGFPGSYGDPIYNGTEVDNLSEYEFNREYGQYITTEEYINDYLFPEELAEELEGFTFSHWERLTYDAYTQLAPAVLSGVSSPTDITTLSSVSSVEVEPI